MKRFRWKSFAALLASGSVLFQAPSCVETAAVVTSAASVASAGGILYLVYQIITQ